MANEFFNTKGMVASLIALAVEDTNLRPSSPPTDTTTDTTLAGMRRWRKSGILLFEVDNDDEEEDGEEEEGEGADAEWAPAAGSMSVNRHDSSEP
jgi:hypothetical protein